ncbi:RNA-binding protein [Nibricoccus aquaticus]|uniref:RNA-binding protein n=1 Tax=Nibricoccus aquaticus TaxID=2576891 RepID=A0A290Q5X2_9BACT|nr:RNA-binding protein [Nibricoccus aquaticus]
MKPASKSSASPAPRPVIVRAVPIELGQLLKFAGLGGSGGEIKTAIKDGEVLLNGAVETRRGKKLAVGDKVSLGSETVIVQLA